MSSINRYPKTNNKYMKDYDKNKESSYFKYWDVNNQYCWTMLQRFSLNGFQWVEDLSEFDGYFINSQNEKSNEECFLENYVQHL